ncbi:TolC family protein [Pontiella sulfatireligans]|uniref:Cobalt-zinc-cadmium resistance protein CzcC n=1 Tax=Pontiella sulfatireligans TaxID=2750658 RepID=A0A6C2UMH5_9BACT|nr:hypothetical protein [Pontiella sulfatireligans]VGO20316.1 hypothetical protein SCARR_02378 [Pontiella sulfatireligans]
MRTILFFLLIFASGVMLPASAAELDLDKVMKQGDLHASIIQRSESVLLEESIALEQARAQAQSRSEYGLELRPRVSDDDVGAALRIYLPSRWSRSKLREQLALVAEEEQLRVALLEWQEIVEVYRLFCEYRMLNRQFELYVNELALLEPYLEKADVEVELNQLLVVDRAKLYSLYLDLVNNQEKVKSTRLGVEQKLYLLIGPNTDLSKMAETAVVEMPSQMQFETMLQQALENRPDYKSFDVHARSIAAAEAVARQEDGFRLKYIQPDVQVDHNNGETTFGLSASFVLPWGTHNPDIAVYQRQQALSQSTMEFQRRVISNRLRVLLKTSKAYYAQAGDRNCRINPLLEQLGEDLGQMETGRLEDLRDLMLVRERMLDVSLQSARALCIKEQIAVDIAKELGMFSN